MSHIVAVQPDRAESETVGSTAPDAIGLGRFYDAQAGNVAGKLRYGGERHVVVFGPNGSGKGTRLLIPNLLQMSGRSLFVVDPKGELAATTALYRATLGRVVILNPFGWMADIPGYEDLKSAGFNPLAALDPAAENFNSRASLLADALITVGGKDPHWDDSARALLATLIMHVCVEAADAGEVPTMARVRELLCQPSGEGNPRLDIPPFGLPVLAEKMAASPIAGLRNKASQFAEWSGEIRSIASSAKRQTECFDDPEISRDMAKNGFDFADMKREPVTVYLVLPPDMFERHSKWLRLVLTAALQAVMRPRRPGEPRCLFILDEFAALGRLQIVSTVWALVRGYGIQIMPVLQNLTQLQSKELYGDNWETFIGMAGVVASFGPQDMTTAEWLSRRAGDTTRIISGHNSGSSHGQHVSSNSGVSLQQVKVPFLPSHDLLGMAPGFMIATVEGVSNVVPAYAPAWWQIEQCRARIRDNPYFVG